MSSSLDSKVAFYFKMKIIFVFIVIYSLTDKLVINLLVVFWIKIANLKFRILSLCSKSTSPALFTPDESIVRQILSFVFARSKKSLLSQKAYCGIYYFVFLERAPSKIFLTLFIGTEVGKILKMLVWDNINVELLFSRDCMKNVNKIVVIFSSNCYKSCKFFWFVS